MPDKDWNKLGDLLNKYQIKRDFKKTKEPKGKLSPAVKKVEAAFVVQEHWASHHHFDLRLEMDGVLKSWAVPKQIPLEKGEKFLAVAVEDHPIEYATFEGEIPEGEYGGGRVKIWDRGTYKIIEQTRKKILFKVKGSKMEGNYALVKFTEDPKNWLLVKEKN